MKTILYTVEKVLGMIIFLTLLILVISLTSCNMDNKKAESDNSISEGKTTTNEMAINEADRKFMEEVVDVNLQEIQMGKLAQAQGNLQEVKDLGKMMEVEHNKALKEIQDLGAKKQVTLPSSLSESGQKDYDELAKKTGKKFDEEYCEMMVKGHKETIEKFEKESSKAMDMDLKALVDATLPVLKNHLEHAKMCEEKCEKMD